MRVCILLMLDVNTTGLNDDYLESARRLNKSCRIDSGRLKCRFDTQQVEQQRLAKITSFSNEPPLLTVSHPIWHLHCDLLVLVQTGGLLFEAINLVCL